jgi:hypothetical protein
VSKRKTLIEDARLKTTRAEAGQDRFTISEPHTTISRSREGDIEPTSAGHLLGERTDEIKAILIKVNQDDFGAIKVGALMNE